jgi:hypothetical protein
MVGREGNAFTAHQASVLTRRSEILQVVSRSRILGAEDEDSTTSIDEEVRTLLEAARLRVRRVRALGVGTLSERSQRARRLRSKLNVTPDILLEGILTGLDERKRLEDELRLAGQRQGEILDQFLELLSDVEAKEREIRELKEAKVVMCTPTT